MMEITPGEIVMVHEELGPRGERRLYVQPPPALAAAILNTLGAVERLTARVAELQEAVARLEARR